MHSWFTSVIETFAEGFGELLSPTRCAVCEKLGTLLCDECKQKMHVIDQSTACACCSAPFGSFVCTECSLEDEDGERNFSFDNAIAFTLYGHEAGRVIKVYKDLGEQRLARVIGQEIAQAVKKRLAFEGLMPHDAYDALTFIPSTKNALRRRGFDHIEYVAAEVASALNISLVSSLVHFESGDQRLLNRKERAKNAHSSFQVALKQEAIPDKVLLIDDVFTTGATLNAAAFVLKQAGVKCVDVAVFARVI